MKRKFDHSAPAGRELTGPKYWRSLDELAFAHRRRGPDHRRIPMSLCNGRSAHDIE